MHASTTLEQPPGAEALASAALAVAGTAAIGWIVELGDNVFASIKMAVVTPAILVGLTCALTPALYILLALTGASTEPGKFAAAVIAGLRATGLTAIALAAPLLFLAATTSSASLSVLFGGAGLALALLVGIAALEKRASDRHTTTSAVAMIGWSLAALAIGLRLFAEAIA